jgi:hypothetical protein
MIRLARPKDEIKPKGITVAEAAEILGVDHSTVRALIRCEAIEGWRVGKTDQPSGIRCELQSVMAYRRRHAIGRRTSKAAGDIPVKRRTVKPSARLRREAVAELRALGVKLPPV